MKENEKIKGYTEKLITLLAKKFDLNVSKYDMNELIMGVLIELEHGSQGEKTNITDDDPFKTLQIVLVHMDELPDYYTRLTKMEEEADSVKTKENTEKKEDDEEKEITNKKTGLTKENVSKRFKELCGLLENEEKKQLKNLKYQERNKKLILKEEIDIEKFKIVKFSNDGLGEKMSEDEIDLYKMQKNEKDLF